jgi:hypothetical protein
MHDGSPPRPKVMPRLLRHHFGGRAVWREASARRPAWQGMDAHAPARASACRAGVASEPWADVPMADGNRLARRLQIEATAVCSASCPAFRWDSREDSPLRKVFAFDLEVLPGVTSHRPDGPEMARKAILLPVPLGRFFDPTKPFRLCALTDSRRRSRPQASSRWYVG